jgi:lipoprotein-anchoring transpeptidase ErfK/SrfK
VYDVAVGTPATPSPEGEFTIVNRLTDPTWYASGKAVRPGPANPLGSRWMGLSAPGYGIHGTNAPRSIGKAASHGCIRMRRRDVEELFELVGVGATVELRGERPQMVARILAVRELVVC